MKIFRTMPMTRLVLLLAAGAAVLVAGSVALAARGGSGGTPPPEPLANAVHDALAASEPSGVTARITFTNKLFPSGALTGQTGSALASGATGRLWVDSDGGRLELQSDAGDAQVTWNASRVTVYDASSNTAYVADLPASTPSDAQHGTVPTLDEITKFLGGAGAHWTISAAVPSNVAGQEAYSVRVSPKHDGGLLGSAELAWDAVHGTPLRIAVYAQGSSSPVLALRADHISFGPVAKSDIDVSPPSGAKVVDLSTSGHEGGAAASAVTGLAAVRAAAPFTLVAPPTLVGLPLRDVRLVGAAEARSVVAVYGEGLGAVVVVEHAGAAGSGGTPGGSGLDALPTVSLDGTTAHELATPLGTILSWQAGGLSYALAGSVPPAAAESAARALR